MGRWPARPTSRAAGAPTHYPIPIGAAASNSTPAPAAADRRMIVAGSLLRLSSPSTSISDAFGQLPRRLGRPCAMRSATSTSTRLHKAAIFPPAHPQAAAIF